MKNIHKRTGVIIYVADISLSAQYRYIAVSNIEVFLQIPEAIQTKIAAGSYERIGGVVRDSSTKHVVAWLREGSKISPEVLSKQIAFSSQALMMASVSGLVLNLAMTSASLVTMMAKLDRLSDEIEDLQEEIIGQFQRDRDIRFKSALQAARDALESNNPGTREQRLNQSREKLDEAEMHFKEEFLQSIEKGEATLAQHYLIQAMFAVTSQARTYLETEDLNIARRRLTESVGEYDELTRKLVHSFLGDNPSAFFHRDVADVDVYRLIRILDWLYKPNEQSAIDIIISDMRKDFWNIEVIEPGEVDLGGKLASPIRRLRGQRSPKFNEFLNQIPNILTRIEIAIENLERLKGFELEVRSIRLMKESMQSWTNLSDNNTFTVLVSKQALQIE